MSIYFLSALILVIVGDQILKTTDTGRSISESVWGLNLLHYSKILDKTSRNEGRAFEHALLSDRDATDSVGPALSHPAGFYPNGVVVTVTLPTDTVGHYSLDGSIPTARHARVSGPVSIDESSVLRVRTFGGSAQSSITTAEYLVSKLETNVVINLTMDPVYLFDKHAGIYSNPQQRGRAWERPAILGVVDPSSGDMQHMDVRVRIHGGTSRGSPNIGRKSFRLIIPGERGKFLDWLGAPAGTISSDQSEWVLRGAAGKRQLWSDRFVNRIAHQIGLTAGYMRPVVLYLNGKQWGVFDLIEKVNEDFPENKTSGNDFTLLHSFPLLDPSQKSADYDEWKKLHRFVTQNDLSEPDNYAFVASQIDIKSLIDYFALSIFMADADRPQGNVDIYRAEWDQGGKPGKWKFAVWDFDGGLNFRGQFVFHDTLAWHLRTSVQFDLKPLGEPDNERLSGATWLLRGLMQNDAFQGAFLERFDALLTSTFSTDNLMSTLESLIVDYKEVLHLNKQQIDERRDWLLEDVVPLNWREPDFGYEDRMNEIEQFISERPQVVDALLRRHFGSANLPVGDASQ